MGNAEEPNEEMKKIMKALVGERVEISLASGELTRGVIQSASGLGVTIDDGYGGAWSMPYADIKGLRIDEGMSVLVILKRVSAQLKAEVVS